MSMPKKSKIHLRGVWKPFGYFSVDVIWLCCCVRFYVGSIIFPDGVCVFFLFWYTKYDQSCAMTLSWNAENPITVSKLLNDLLKSESITYESPRIFQLLQLPVPVSSESKHQPNPLDGIPVNLFLDHLFLNCRTMLKSPSSCQLWFLSCQYFLSNCTKTQLKPWQLYNGNHYLPEGKFIH